MICELGRIFDSLWLSAICSLIRFKSLAVGLEICIRRVMISRLAFLFIGCFILRLFWLCALSDKCYIFSWTFIAASLRTDIDAQLEKLDQDFRAGKISGDEYADQRQKLKQTKEGLLDELHRMGVVI